MKRGSWALLDRFEIPDLDEPERLYLTRWRIVETPCCALFLHRMTSPDSRPTLHDHPWSFISIVLRGGYDEVRRNPHFPHTGNLPRRIRRLNVMRRDDAHYIESLHRAPTWTLLLVGKRRRLWGYWRHVDGSSRRSWYWTPFNTDIHSAEFDAAMAVRKNGRGRPHDRSAA